MFFVKVFKALKNTENTKIMEKMLKVVTFYINNDASAY